MPKKTFISYNYSDAELAHTVRSHFNNGGGPIQGKPVSVKENVSDDGPKAIDRTIKQAMSGCDEALFIVGDNAHNSRWISREAELAVSQGIPVTVAQLPGSNGGVPEALNKVPHEKVAFSGTQIANTINHRGVNTKAKN